MRPINIDWHVAGLQLVIYARALWSEANQSDLVLRFRDDVDQIIFIGPGLSDRGERSEER